MIPNYTYIPAAAFINNLAFDYVETYSFQRGTKYELQQKEFDEEYNKLIALKSKSNSLTTEEEDRINVLQKLCSTTQYLLDDNNQFHYSSIKTNTFSSTDPKIELLKSIFNTETKEALSLLCAPVYRDAFVFYTKDGKLAAALNVCLSCLYMETSRFNHINADYKVYHQLKRFFISIGHDVEDPKHFPFDDIEK